MVSSALVGCDVKVDGAVSSGIGETLADELLDEAHVLGNELGDAGDGGRGEDVERAHVLVEMALPVGRELREHVLRVGAILVERVEVGEEDGGGGEIEGFGGRSVAAEGPRGREQRRQMHLELGRILVESDVLFGGLGRRAGFARFFLGYDGREACVGLFGPRLEARGGDDISVGVAGDLGVEVGRPGGGNASDHIGRDGRVLSGEFVEQMLLAGAEDNLLEALSLAKYSALALPDIHQPYRRRR